MRHKPSSLSSRGIRADASCGSGEMRETWKRHDSQTRSCASDIELSHPPEDEVVNIGYGGIALEHPETLALLLSMSILQLHGEISEIRAM